jgi:ABC-type proline/glycine betaine transport system permease subunit
VAVPLRKSVLFRIARIARIRNRSSMTNSWNAIVVGLLGIIPIAAFIGAFFGGFAIAGKSRDKKHYVLRGIFWSFLIFFGGILALAALAFGACILLLSGMKF